MIIPVGHMAFRAERYHSGGLTRNAEGEMIFTIQLETGGGLDTINIKDNADILISMYIDVLSRLGVRDGDIRKVLQSVQQEFKAELDALRKEREQLAAEEDKK